MTDGRTMSTHRGLVTRLLLTASAMFAFGFALVPLYDVFCELTGIRFPIEATDAATVQETTAAARNVKMVLLANTQAGAPLEFRPVYDTIDVTTGRLQDTQFVARNLTSTALTAVATPDIRPAEAARYIRKIECFCFNEQQFAAGEERKLSVRFFVDPELPDHIDNITLAYTLFEKQPLASN